MNPTREDRHWPLRALVALQGAGPLAERLGTALDIVLAGQGQAHSGAIFALGRDTALRLLVARGPLVAALRAADPSALHAVCPGPATTAGILLSAECPAAVFGDRPELQSRGHCVVPLVAAAGVQGLMLLFTDPDSAWEPDDLSTLEEVGRALGATIEREERAELETTRRLLATLGHGINNPLQGILSNAESLLGGVPDPARVTEHACNITAAAQRIARFLRTCELVQRVERERYCGDIEMLRLYD